MGKNKTFSVAMIISLLGLLVLSGGTWIGLALRHVSPAIAAIAAIVVLLVGGVSVFLGVRAKTAESDFNKWRRYEILCIAGMFLSAGFAVMPTAITFNFIHNNRELRHAASADIQGIDSLITVFNENETARMNATFRGLENFVRLGNNNCSPAMRQYLENEFRTTPGHFSTQLINNRRGEIRAQIDDIRLGNSMYGNVFNNRIRALRGVVSSRIPIGFGRLGTELSSTSEQIGDVLTDISGGLSLPVVSAGSGQQYTVRPSQSCEYRFEPTAYVEAYGCIFVWTFWSILFSVLSVLAAVFYYLISYRTIRKAVDRGSKVSDRLGLPL